MGSVRQLRTPRLRIRQRRVRQWGSAVRTTAASAGRGAAALALMVALTIGVIEPATAAAQPPAGGAQPASAPSPTPPPNPSDDDIESSQQQADAAATEVGQLSGEVSATESRISALQNDMEYKAEQANKAIVDLGIAKDDAAMADEAAKAAADAADRAQGDITVAEQEAAEFAAASFRNGSTLGSMTALLGSKSPTDLLQTDAMLEQISSSQLDVIGALQAARNVKANKDAAARAALDEAEQAQQRATDAAAFAEQAKQQAAAALRSGQRQLAELTEQLRAQEQAYSDALNSTEALKEQREAYNTWLAEKKAEEERQRRIAEERARKARAEAARRAAAEKAAAEARAQAREQAEAEAAAKAKAEAEARRAAAAKKAAHEAAVKAQQEKNAKRKAAAHRAAKKKQAEADRAAARAAKEKKAQQRRAAEARRSEANRKAAEKAAAQAKAEQERRAELRRQANEKSRIANARKAKEQADRLKQIRGQGTGSGAYFRDCDAARAAGYAPLHKGEPGYRPALDPNGNDVACDAGTPAEPTYYIDCDGARARGAAPLHEDDPGYRAGLDPNGNGVACDAGTSSDPTYTESSPAPTVPSADVPADGSVGSLVVNAALAYLGTPYSWGGGNADGPSYGIDSGSGIWGFDCSGLVLYAWAQAGVSLPHYSAYQYMSGQHIAREDLQPGDLVFFANNTSDPNTIHHVAIYMGNGQLIEAPQSGVPVRIRGWRTDGYIGATRPGT